MGLDAARSDDGPPARGQGRDEQRTVTGALQSAPEWFVAMVLSAAAIGAYGVQVFTFWHGFHVAIADPPSVPQAQMLAGLGLAATVAAIVMVALAVRRGYLGLVTPFAIVAIGAAVGAWVGGQLPEQTGGFIMGELFLYLGAVVIGGAMALLVLLGSAAILRWRGHGGWVSALASPLLLQIGAHASLLIGLWVHADAIAAAA